MDVSFKISVLALLFSLVALTWNIIKDIYLDRINLSVRMFAGEVVTDDRGVQRQISVGRQIGILGVEKNVTAETIFFQIVNIGRRDVEVDCIFAEYMDGSSWVLPIDEKRYLKPYESVNANTTNSSLKEYLKNGGIKSIYIKDTKDKKWNFSDQDIVRARRYLS